MNYIYPTQTKVTRKQREILLHQRSMLIWFTGLSGAGKSTLSIELEARLVERGFKTYLLDGDNIRSGLSNDLAFSSENRKENIRRIAEVSKLFLDAGLVVLAAFVSPYRDGRDMVRRIVGAESFIEVFVDCPLEVCEARDTKGLYKKARQGMIPDFTGISSPYETPETPDLTIRSDTMGIGESVELLLSSVLPRLTLSR